MCTGMEPAVLASIIGGGSAVAGSAIQAHQAGRMKPPEPPQLQGERAPNIESVRRRATRGLSSQAVPRTALTTPVTGASTLLGQ